MSVVLMEKIHLVALQQYQDSIIKTLEKNEVLDIQTFSQKETLPAPFANETAKFDLNLAELKSTITFLGNLLGNKKSFMESFIPPREETTEQEIIRTYQEFNADAVSKECQAIENRLSNLHNLKKELLADFDKLWPWQSLNITLDHLNGFTQTKTTLGSIKLKDWPIILAKLAAFSTTVIASLVSVSKNTAYIAITFMRSEEDELKAVLAKTNFQPAALPQIEKTVKQELAQIKSTLKTTETDLAAEVNQAKKLAHHLPRLKYVYDYILGQKLSLEIKHKFAKTKYTFVIEGWIQKNQLTKVQHQLKEISADLEIFAIPANQGENPPVLLKNPQVFTPFELITKIYGRPKSNEMDPTLPLSLFFALFFGLCLGDFGYGLALAIISSYFLKRYKLPLGGQQLFQLLLLGGFVSIAVGILTGSYFGASPSELSQFEPRLGPLLSSLQIIDPIKNPIVMLLFSLCLGLIQLFFGMTLQLLNKIRNRDFLSAVIDDGFWLFFLISLVVLLVASALNLAIAALAAKLSMAGAVLLILTQGRHKEKPLEKFFSGLLSLYKVSGYLGDTLSYSRLLALGMSSAIIGTVINILANMAKPVPFFGFIFMILILIVGHVFNLIISVLGAFVHSMRLQMVEFFGKFYEGGGREFKPYKRVAEYTALK